MDLRDKITYSIDLIRRGERLAIELNPEIGYFVGFSGGKDSQALLQLVKMSGVRYKAFYMVTTNDPPENVYFIRRFYPDVEFIHPKENFFKLVRKWGLPSMNRRYCCSLLKEGAGAGCVVLTGVRADESLKRAKYSEVEIRSRRKKLDVKSRARTIDEVEENEHRCIKGKDELMIYPIFKWLESDVWKFLHEQGLQVNPCYEHTGRVGCMFCPFSSRRQLEYYERRYPKYKETLLRYLDDFMQERKDSYWENPEQYYEWWKSRKSVKKYKAELAQMAINFDA